MRKEGLDPKGKVELARMLIQIGFEAEGIAEYLMAAQMYEERGENTKAIELYEKIQAIDADNDESKRGLYRLKPRSTEQIDEIVAKMGLAPKSEPTKEDKQPEPEKLAEEKVEEKPKLLIEPEPSLPVAETKESEHITDEEVEAPVVKPVPSKPAEVQPEEAKVISTEDITTRKNIDEQLATLIPLLADMPDNSEKRAELGDFFKDEGLYSEAFFEIRGTYIYEPTIEKLKILIELLNEDLDRKSLISFLHTESLLDRPRDVMKIVLETLATTYDEEGMDTEAADVKQKLKELETRPVQSKKSNVKIIEDKPKLGKPKKKTEKDQSGPIQFI
jgi:tetratricopeptide (TPR) repeat protein